MLRSFTFCSLLICALISCDHRSRLTPHQGCPDSYLYPTIEEEPLVKLRCQLADIKKNAYAIRVRETLNPNHGKLAPQHQSYNILRQPHWEAIIDRWIAANTWKSTVENPDFKIFVSLPTHWTHVDFIDKNGRRIFSVDEAILGSYVYTVKESNEGDESLRRIYEDVKSSFFKDYPRLQHKQEE